MDKALCLAIQVLWQNYRLNDRTSSAFNTDGFRKTRMRLFLADKPVFYKGL
jgi:hypothetical protein